MKKCPFCAEEIQDAAIKCRYCGSSLVEVPVPTLNEQLKHLLDEGKKIEAAQLLLRERKPKMRAAVIKIYLQAVKDGTDPERAIADAAAIPPSKFRTLKLLGLSLGISFALIFIVAIIAISVDGPTARADAARRAWDKDAAQNAAMAARTAQNAAGAANQAAQKARRDAAARVFMTAMVKRGLIRRMDVARSTYYIWGDLWDVFEVDQKEQLVKSISEYQDAESNHPQVTLREFRSGKELANYGVFTGVTIR